MACCPRDQVVWPTLDRLSSIFLPQSLEEAAGLHSDGPFGGHETWIYLLQVKGAQIYERSFFDRPLHLSTAAVIHE